MEEETRKALTQLRGELAAVRNGSTLRPSHEGFHVGPVRLYVKLVGTAFHLFQQEEDGTETDLTLAGSGGGVHGPTSHTEGTAWRMVYANATGDETEFALGADGTFLESNGAAAAPAFRTLAVGDLPGHGASKHTEGTAWRLTYQNADGDDTEIALGADGTFLESNGAAAAPAFRTLAAADVPTATAGAAGVVSELATAAETTAGTDASRVVTPDGLAGSDYGKRIMYIKEVIAAATALTTGDAKTTVVIPSEINGWLLVNAQARVYTVATGATLVNIQVRNVTDAANMLSTAITIDASELTSYTAATQRVINAAQDDVLTGEIIAIDIDAIGNTTPGNGLDVILTFQLDPA